MGLKLGDKHIEMTLSFGESRDDMDLKVIVNGVIEHVMDLSSEDLKAPSPTRFRCRSG